jgi:hypothetical protein
MQQNKFSEIIFSESDVCDLLMQGRQPDDLSGMIVDDSVKLQDWPDLIESIENFQSLSDRDITVEEFHRQQQSSWHMPDQYKNMDIAAYVLGLCTAEAELQRCGAELLLYQERDLFNLLKYLKYLVDTMTANHIIWGVGRGSSVSSYVLYLLGVHRIDSMFYNLDIAEFLR